MTEHDGAPPVNTPVPASSPTVRRSSAGRPLDVEPPTPEGMIPTPGSSDARHVGPDAAPGDECRCHVLDNNAGSAMPPGGWLIDPECGMHNSDDWRGQEAAHPSQVQTLPRANTDGSVTPA